MPRKKCPGGHFILGFCVRGDTFSIIGVNSKGSELILGDEIRVLSVEKKQELLHSAGVQMEMLPMQGLAIKCMLAIPWYRLRILRRYIGYIGVHRILHVCV